MGSDKPHGDFRIHLWPFLRVDEKGHTESHSWCEDLSSVGRAKYRKAIQLRIWRHRVSKRHSLCNRSFDSEIWPDRRHSCDTMSVLEDAAARLARPGKQRQLLWGTSLKTATYDDGAWSGGVPKISWGSRHASHSLEPVGLPPPLEGRIPSVLRRVAWAACPRHGCIPEAWRVPGWVQKITLSLQQRQFRC